MQSVGKTRRGGVSPLFVSYQKNDESDLGNGNLIMDWGRPAHRRCLATSTST